MFFLRFIVVMTAIVLPNLVHAATAGTASPAPGTSLAVLQEQQNIAVSKVRFATVSVRAWNQNNPGLQSIGAGVVVTCKGAVVTNSHVVSGFDTIEVGLLEQGGVHSYQAMIVKDDPKLDLTLLKTSKSGECISAALSTAQVTVGERILVIGSPFGYNHTVTSGIISSAKRDISLDNINYTDMIQSDAAINQGNSGGPMINLKGEVVGITSAIFSKTQTTNGIGFAIPSSRVQAFLEQSLKYFDPGQTVALTTNTTTTTKSKINLTEKADHPFLGDCLKCHTLAFKTPITPGEPMPHPAMGPCTNCHEIVKTRTGKVVTVSQTDTYLGREQQNLQSQQKAAVEPVSSGFYIRYIVMMLLVLGGCFVIYKAVASYSGTTRKKDG